MSKVRPQKLSLLIFILAFINLSCDDKPPITEQKFMEVYVNLLIAQDTTATPYNSDSLKSVILASHNITEKQYDSMIDYYNEKPEKWTPFFDSVTAYVERLKLSSENQP